MNILIIGNGFDLAHGLPTKYTDILQFLKFITQTASWSNDVESFSIYFLDAYNAPAYVKEYIKNAFLSRETGENGHVFNANPLVQEIYDNLTNNIWYEYLYELYITDKMKGINWIDFESEISEIIEQIDKNQENLYMPFDMHASDGNEKLKLFLTKLKKDAFIKDEYKYKEHIPTYRDFLDKSYADLRRLVRCIEIYLTECVEKQSISVYSQDINNIDVKAVLCFNYTHTYEKLYNNSDKLKVHYLHGETKEDGSVNNMVLGIDEYYGLNDKDKHTNYNIYKKFTQRVLNETGFLYRDWIESMDYETQLRRSMKEKFPNHVYIFGHSLDVTDRDVIKDIIDRDGVITTIFYYDKQQQTQQIANLVKMLGQDRFIDMINSVPQSICFVHQQPMVQKK